MIAMPDTAMVMAAGLGKRMRPLTATTPKPLVRVAGKPLIDHSLDRLGAAGVARAVVNVHYLPEQIEAHCAARRVAPQVTISDERDLLLETGGGLAAALPMLGADPFFCVNSDNIWLNGPQDALHRLAARWDGDRMDALLLVVSHARAFGHGGPGDFHLDSMGRVSRRRGQRVAPFIFTGIQIVHPRLIADPPAAVFSTNIFWNRAIAAGRLYAVPHDGLWFDIGSPTAIAPAEAMLAEAA
jgi:MurNAc alpha-1-phosphate uridylyltransferase